MKTIKGGVTAPKGFLAGAVSCGIKKSGKRDLSILMSEVPAVSAGVFTTNKVKSGSLVLCMDRIKRGIAQAIVVNSGNANCCVGVQGIKDAEFITDNLACKLGIDKQLVLMASTGIIGKPLPVEKINNGLDSLIRDLSDVNGAKFSNAIMTTDTVNKEISVQIKINKKIVNLGGAAKGAGMICPNMATMLAFFTTDAKINKADLKTAFMEAISQSFNKITVDWDMSTNDTAVIFANGMADNEEIRKGTKPYEIFSDALKFTACELAKKIVLDGEGAAKFIEIIVKNSKGVKMANLVARHIAESSLVKTMVAGGDPNWGRIAASVGSSRTNINPDKLDIYFGKYLVMKNGAGTGVTRDKLLEIFKQKEIKIIIDLKSGKASDKIWTCDLTEQYVRINAEYET